MKLKQRNMHTFDREEKKKVKDREGLSSTSTKHTKDVDVVQGTAEQWFAVAHSISEVSRDDMAIPVSDPKNCVLIAYHNTNILRHEEDF